MARGRLLVSAVALAAVFFCLGILSGSRSARRPIGPDEGRARIQRALVASDRLEQASLLIPVFQAMGPDDAEELARVFESAFASGGSDFPLELFVEGWARLDPEASRRKIAGWPPDVSRQAWPTLIRAWARSNPKAAAGALEQIPDPSVRKVAGSALIEGWSDAGDPGVWKYLAGLPDNPRRRELASLVVRAHLSQKGAEALFGELEALPEAAPMDSFKGEALVTAAAAVAPVDLDRAVALAERQRASAHGSALLLPVAARWAALDPPAAIQWLRAQPPGEGRDRALDYAYRRWMKSDRNAATTWLASGIRDPDLAPAVVAHASMLAQDDPAAAAAWAGGLPDPDLRSRSVEAIGRVERAKEQRAARTQR